MRSGSSTQVIDLGPIGRERWRDGKTFRYRVTATSVVRFDASGIDPLADGYQLALTTCWPLDAVTSGPMRYVVHATMVR